MKDVSSHNLVDSEMRIHRARQVEVESPARLHLGFVDLNGDMGRMFGSLGLALEDLSTVVQAERAANFAVHGVEAERAQHYASAILNAYELPHEIKIDVSRAIPSHAGLGSGTQLALAIGTAITDLFDIERDVRRLASVSGRGLRSGIGIGVFERGGFVVDGGNSGSSTVPPLVARFEFPDAWRVLLIHDNEVRGLHGAAETSAFASAEPMSRSQSEELCRATLMGIFPALMEQDFATFAHHVATIQVAIGDYFGAYQGGRFASVDVAAAIQWLQENYNITGVGQTSWGPTGFAFVDDDARGNEMLNAVKTMFSGKKNLSFSLCKARNRGAHTVQTSGASPQITAASG